jgi:cytosine/adenosine deaminase-related metal-dependent hydrolase
MIFDQATIITMNPKREIITHGAIAVSGKKLVAVGKSRDVVAQFPEKRRIDCNGNLLLPGLIDTHVHTAQALIRGCADNLALLDWLSKRVWVLQGNYTEEDGRASASLCLLEMIKAGTTAFIECMLAERYGFDGVAGIVTQSGMRAALAKIVMDLPAYARADNFMHPGMVEEGDASLHNTLAAYDRWHGQAEGRLQVWFGPRTPGGVTPALYRQIAQLARERNMGMTLHLSEIRADLEYAAAQGFRSPVELAEAYGLLGPRTVLAHCVWTDEADWSLLASSGTHVTHNPASNAKLASGIAPVREMLAAGVNVALGCDGGPSNNTYDLIRDMRLTGYLASLKRDDPAALLPETILELVTINGAKAMGIADHAGSLEVGKRADFILINMDAPHLTPSWDPVATLVYAAHGSDVDTVVIDGQIVMQGRKVFTLDEGAILADVRTRHPALSERASLKIIPRWPVV